MTLGDSACAVIPAKRSAEREPSQERDATPAGKLRLVLLRCGYEGYFFWVVGVGSARLAGGGAGAAEAAAAGGGGALFT